MSFRVLSIGKLRGLRPRSGRARDFDLPRLNGFHSVELHGQNNKWRDLQQACRFSFYEWRNVSLLFYSPDDWILISKTSRNRCSVVPLSSTQDPEMPRGIETWYLIRNLAIIQPRESRFVALNTLRLTALINFVRQVTNKLREGLFWKSKVTQTSTVSSSVCN